MNMMNFIVSLMAVVVLGHVTGTNFGFNSGYFPSLLYPSSGLWSGGWGGGYSHGSVFGGFKFPSSYGYLPKDIQKPVPVFTEGGHGDGDGFGNGGLILVLVIFLVLTRIIGKYWTPATSGNDVIISFL